MKFILIIVLFLQSFNSLVSNDEFILISNLQVMKRNKPTCYRLGNIYDACQWMLKFKLINNTKKNLISFCSIIKINEEKYKLCGNKKKTIHTAAKSSSTVLINLSQLINYDNDNPKPNIIITSLKGKYSITK